MDPRLQRKKKIEYYPKDQNEIRKTYMQKLFLSATS